MTAWPRNAEVLEIQRRKVLGFGFGFRVQGFRVYGSGSMAYKILFSHAFKDQCSGIGKYIAEQDMYQDPVITCHIPVYCEHV